MDSERYLTFLNHISKDKPNDFIENKSQECPFCNREKLENIIDEKGPFILLRNKYPTLKNTIQLVIIETYKCEGNMSEYSDEYIKDLIKFSVGHWLNLEKSKKYKSIIFYKNHGPHSGGSLKHPHMQIVGIENMDYREKIKDEYFKGIEIHKNENCTVNLSTEPFSGFSEFNIIISDNLLAIDELAINLKKLTHYILNNYFSKCDSFNIFFYHWNNKIICKVVPRFTTSPLLLGYGIKQIPSLAGEIADKLKYMYFS